jgi:hypothetical protein
MLRLAIAAVLSAVPWAISKQILADDPDNHGPRAGLIAEWRPVFPKSNKFSIESQKLGDDTNSGVTIDQTVVNGPIANITVRWYNMTFTGKSDWIGLFAEGDDVGANAPIKFKYVSPEGRWAPASGAIWFEIINRRTRYFAIYVSGTSQYWEEYGRSGFVTFENLFAPLNGHLGLTPSVRKTTPVSIDVMWNQKAVDNAGVWYSTTSGGPYTFLQATQSYTFGRSDLCDADTQPAAKQGWFNPGFFLSTTLPGLSAATTYHYKYGDTYGVSEEKTFTTPPLATSSATIYTFGDMGQAPTDHSFQHSWDFGMRGEYPALNTSKILNEVVDAGDLVLHIGDISYAVGFLSEWDQFMQQIEPVASKVLWQTGIGNHEFGHSGSFFGPFTDSGGECGVPYLANFPNALSDSPNLPYQSLAPWYSFDYGPVHVVITSTEHNFTMGSEQHQWVVSDLEAVDRSVTPWIVFTGHRPMYPDSTWVGDSSTSEMLSVAFEELFMKYDVNLCLWAHEHVYVRTCPIYMNECMEAGEAPTHMVIGMAGYDLSKTIGTHHYARFSSNKHYGIVKMDFPADSRTATIQFMDNGTGDVLDSFTLTRDPAKRKAAYEAWRQRNYI